MPKFHRTIRITALIGLAGTLVNACGEDINLKPTVTLQQAETTLRDHINQAATAAFPHGFTLRDRGPLPQGCTDPTGKPDGRVDLGLTFWVDGIDQTKNNTYFDALKAWWPTRNWAHQTDSRPQDMFINATDQDGYLMGLETSSEGRLTIEGTTPCVWRNGTPEPRN